MRLNKNQKLIDSPEARDFIQKAGLSAMNDKANELGAKIGMSHVWMRSATGGLRHTMSEPLNGIWPLSYDMDMQFEGDSAVGYNLDGFAFIKMAYTERTKLRSEPTAQTAGYGEVADLGSDIAIISCDTGAESLESIEICAGFSGMESEEDLAIATAGIIAMKAAIETICAQWRKSRRSR